MEEEDSWQIAIMGRTQWLLLVHVRVQDYLRTRLYAYNIMLHTVMYPLACVFFEMETSVFHGNIFLSFLRWLEQSWCEAKKMFPEN